MNETWPELRMSLASEHARRVRRQMLNEELFILVWGPGTGAEGFGKRQQIRRELKEHFPAAEVHFSEDPELEDELPETQGWPLRQKELFHLAACTLCVVLDVSKGAGEEIAHYGASKFARKLYVLTREEYKSASSLPAALREHLVQEFFSADEYASCNLVKRVIQRAEQVALAQLCGVSL